MFQLRRLTYEARAFHKHLSVIRAGNFLLTRELLPVVSLNAQNAHSGTSGNGTKSFKNVANGLLAAVGVSGGYLLFQYLDNKDTLSAATSTADEPESNTNEFKAGAHRALRNDLPTYRMSAVREHNTLEKGVWVTYGIGVYDITKFIPQHPGSDKIMLGAGSAIDPFWHTYQQHNTQEILELLESYRIGNLAAEDDIGTKDLDSPWANEPERHPILQPASVQPYNAMPPMDILVETFMTPNEFFFVRNHLPVPVIDENTFELEIEVEGSNTAKTFTMKDLKKLPKKTVMAAVMCGGNRREDMHKIKPVRGLRWGGAAVGNADWSGVYLRDILIAMGVEKDENKHVIMEGYDLDPTGTPYAASVPLYKVMDERGDVLLAYEMNGKPLPRDHGYPLRAIVPGSVGARNIKWLAKIVISDKESDSHWQQKDYKGFSPSTDWDNVDFSKSPAIQNMPVTSAICQPLAGEKVKVVDGHITVRGYAWSGGGNQIVRVDLTADGGDSWYVADLEQTDVKPGRHYSWTLWTAKIPVGNEKKEVEIWAKAVDSNYNVQPESFKNTWNLRGILSHAYSRVKVNLVR